MLGDKIKTLRKKRNLTQVELAKKLTIAQSTLGMIESNQREGSKKTLKKLADFFGVTVDYLLSSDEEISDVVKEESTPYGLSIKEQENIDEEAKKIIEDLSMSFSKNKDNLNEEDYFAIENAIRSTLEAIKIKNKKKFTPKKYRK